MLVGLLKKILRKRPELRLVISSATMDAELFYNFYNTNPTTDKTKDTCVILSLPGRMFPVDVHYLEEPAENYVLDSVDTVFKIHAHEKSGDILLFLTGRDEVEDAVSIITSRAQEYVPIDIVNVSVQYTLFLSMPDVD